MEGWIERISSIELVLGGALAGTALLTIATRHRGGRFRALPGWLGFLALFSLILVSLSRFSPWLSLVLLGLLMFVGLRTYFFVAPVRPRDRYAILAAYLAIPFALYAGFAGSHEAFLATVPIVLFLLFPVLLSVGRQHEGLLDSMGRILLGVLLFLFCAAHLGLFVRWGQPGLPELFGALVVAADLPQRLAGRFREGTGWLRPALGVLAGLFLAAWLGYWTGPLCGLAEEDGARAGFLVALAVTMGALVTDAVIRDLARGSSPARVGRIGLLDRTIPAVYAAPVFFHYLNHFA
jgi:predicted CDP-diglyceride synthetase/phosphatidate cytidylyltransferase